MCRIILFIACLYTSFGIQAQRFNSYHSFGIEVNVATSNMEVSKLLVNETNNPAYAPLNEPITTLDVYGKYDFGIRKWLGLSSGLGFICRGGENRVATSGPNFNQEADKRLLFYASLPLTLQLKPFKVFWLEAGLLTNFYLFKVDEGYFIDNNGDQTPNHFYEESIKPVVLNWQAGFRVNLYRGLSLNAGYYSSITPLAEEASSLNPAYVTKLKNYGFQLGIRYMFKQPLP